MKKNAQHNARIVLAVLLIAIGTVAAVLLAWLLSVASWVGILEGPAIAVRGAGTVALIASMVLNNPKFARRFRRAGRICDIAAYGLLALGFVLSLALLIARA